jgi:tetratricopeptide (TPR) repeat protein
MLLPWFRKRIDPEAVGREHWRTSFRWLERRRLDEHDGPDYSAWARRRRFSLLLERENLFAWTTNSLLRFDDFVVEARASFDPANGHSALGFVLRYVDESNFYYFLVSNRGLFRFDLVFNGNPTPLIGWVANPLIAAAGNPLRVIVRGSHFSFYVDDDWIGEVEDETIRVGRFGFAAQNYDERPRALFTLESLALEARPLEVERAYFRWVEHVPANPQYRLALARAFAEREQFAAAVVQLHRSLRGRRGTAEELFLLVECLMRLRMHAEALDAVERTLQAVPDHEGALQEKANLLYLLNRLSDADEHLRRILPRFPASSPLWNLAGNVAHALGRFDDAEAAYFKAIELEPGMPLYRVNAARTLVARARDREALVLFREAARELFREEAYDDLPAVLARIRRIEPADVEARALEAKVHYHEGRKREAETLLRELAAEGCADSAVSYLYGMVLIERGLRREALAHLRRAAELEPASALYRFRLAEALHLLGEDCSGPLAEARALAPGDPWINNLHGQLLLADGQVDEAVATFAAALRSLPEEADISANLAEALTRRGSLEEAKSVLARALERHPDDARLLNQRGNHAVLARDFAAALSDYEKALEADPTNVEIAKNLAAVCVETDMILRAEELLGWLTEQSPTPEVYNLNAHLALVQGERGRAELSLKAGLELDPRNTDLRVNLARLYLERGDVERARGIVTSLLEREPANEKALRVRDRIREGWETQLSCSGCGRSWWVPRQVPPQPPLRLHGEPPAECPAGRCTACGRVYCIGCASQAVVEGRMRCAACGGPLKLDDDSLRYLVLRYVRDDDGTG